MGGPHAQQLAHAGPRKSLPPDTLRASVAVPQPRHARASPDLQCGNVVWPGAARMHPYGHSPGVRGAGKVFDLEAGEGLGKHKLRRTTSANRLLINTKRMDELLLRVLRPQGMSGVETRLDVAFGRRNNRVMQAIETMRINKDRKQCVGKLGVSVPSRMRWRWAKWWRSGPCEVWHTKLNQIASRSAILG